MEGLGDFEYEADPRHRSVVVNYFGFNDRTSGQLTIGRVDESKTEVDEVELSDFEATKFRGVAVRVNFLAQVASWARLERLARYLVTQKRP